MDSERGNLRVKKWYGTVNKKHVPLSTDKQAARSILRDLERKSEREKAGLIDPFEHTRQGQIADFVSGYLKDMRLRGRSVRHIADTERLLKKVLKSCGILVLAELTAEKLDNFLAGLACSARTKVTHRQACMGFANWLVRKGKLPANPLATSTKPEGKATRERRALSLEQLRKLVAVTRERPLFEVTTCRSGHNRGQRYGRVRSEVRQRLELLGRERSLIYRTAFYTGLRRGELAALKVGHLILDGAKPAVNLPGEFTKNGQSAHLPLRTDLAEDLGSWVRVMAKQSFDPLFAISRDINKIMRRDLKMAGIPYRDEHGRVADFHSLRKCLASNLNVGGVPIVTAKEIMRHSTVELTAGVYNDSTMHDLRTAINSLPEIL